MLSDYFCLTENSFVGYITQLTYDTATIMSHDFQISKANFVPKGAFLLVKVEDENQNPFAYFLLRVLNISYIDQDSKLNKEITIQRATQYEGHMLDLQREINDPVNQNKLAFYQLNCNLLGTFYEKDNKVHFGSDVYSFNVAHIYKVYKPIGENLSKIANFIKEDRLQATHELFKTLTDNAKLEDFVFEIGHIRYASTLLDNEESENKDIASVKIYPSDFIKQKTGVFGMTRTGKSNTVKIMIKSIMELSKNTGMKVGQIIYDINGEYANDNDQNKKICENNLYTVDNGVLEKSHHFLPALNNFYFSHEYGLKVIQKGIKSQGKESNYINTFLAIENVTANPLIYICWITLLYMSGYQYPSIKEGKRIHFVTDKSFMFLNQTFYIGCDDTLYEAISNYCPTLLNLLHYQMAKEHCFFAIQEQDLPLIKKYFQDKVFKQVNGSFQQLLKSLNYANESFIASLFSFIVQEDISSGKAISMSGWQMVVPYQHSHCPLGVKDYRVEIYDKLIKGETVIIDFSIGDPFTRLYVADELMQYIFDKQIDTFREKQRSPIINVLIEEAHNVIGGNAALDSLWPRIAKEGAKYNIGLMYVTQEPSGIHESILSNTANFVIAHLNNEKEIKTIAQYEDMGDFKDSIKRSEDVGFVRLRVLSKPYTIPVQINKFN